MTKFLGKLTDAIVFGFSLLAGTLIAVGFTSFCFVLMLGLALRHYPGEVYTRLQEKRGRR